MTKIERPHDATIFSWKLPEEFRSLSCRRWITIAPFHSEVENETRIDESKTCTVSNLNLIFFLFNFFAARREPFHFVLDIFFLILNCCNSEVDWAEFKMKIYAIINNFMWNHNLANGSTVWTFNCKPQQQPKRIQKSETKNMRNRYKKKRTKHKKKTKRKRQTKTHLDGCVLGRSLNALHCPLFDGFVFASYSSFSIFLLFLLFVLFAKFNGANGREHRRNSPWRWVSVVFLHAQKWANE